MKKLLLSFASLALLASGNAQVSQLGGPLAWKHTFLQATKVPAVTFPGFDLAAIQAEDAVVDAEKSAPWRFGYKYSTAITPENNGLWETLPDGGKLWRVELVAPGALTMNLLLENYSLPDGAYIYLYDKAGTNRVGAYTSLNNREDGLLGTELMHGDHMIVEYYEPATVAGQGHFTITDVVHGYRTLGPVQNQLEKGLNDSGACNVDVNCPLGDLWGPQIRSVAMIVVNGNGICSGALINNTCNDGTPYFLTANHCLGGSTGSWAFRFNWESPEGTEICAANGNSVNPGPPYDQTMNGATTLVNSGQADVALLQITNLTVQNAIDMGLFYAGWNHIDTPGSITQATGIHHPSGDLKKICRENQSPTQQTTGGAAVWWIADWDNGVTEPGSSGSPLFDQEGRIIGQLYGGAAACSGTNDNSQYDFYGRLGVSWGLGVSTYLAPTTCGAAPDYNYGYDPNPATAGIARPIPSIEFVVSPNPGNGDFMVTFADGNVVNGTLTVRDMTGRLVYTQELQEADAVNINLSALAGGAYVLHVTNDFSAVSETIIVQK